MKSIMQQYRDCPQVLRDFLTYHENIKGQSQLTIREYYLDLRMFFRFMKLMRNEMPIDTDLESIDIRDIDLDFIGSITQSEIFDFLSYLANDRVARPDMAVPEHGIEAASRARKLSAIKSFYKYLTVRTKQRNQPSHESLKKPVNKRVRAHSKQLKNPTQQKDGFEPPYNDTISEKCRRKKQD